MAIKKSLIVTGIVASVGLASMGAIGTVAADSNSHDSLASKIAQKFSINQNEVQDVLDEHREEMKAEHEQKLEDRLSQAVTDGELTDEQKAKIELKLEELRKQSEENKDKFKDMSTEERHKFMEDRKAELESWAKENGIPNSALKYLMPHHGHGGPGHHRDK